MERKKWSWTTLFKGAGGVIAALGTLVTILVTLGIVGGSDGGSAIADAAQTTADAGSARVQATARKNIYGVDVAVSGEAFGDFRTGEGKFTQTSTFDIPPYQQGGPARVAITTRQVFTGSACYTRIPADLVNDLSDLQAIRAGLAPARPFSRDEQAALRLLIRQYGPSILKLTPQSPWIEADRSPPRPSNDPNDEFTMLLGGEAFNDPSQTLALLGEIANLDEVGDETLFGVPTKHYKGSLAIRDLPATLPEVDQAQGRAAARRLVEQTGTARLSVEIWIDDQGLVRRLILETPVVAGITVPIQLDFFDFGIPVTVRPPSADQVVHFTAPGLCSSGIF